jgi:5-methylcytosine-specific restriction endonuclease McrA
VSRHHETFKNDPRWKAVRAACLDRDGHACVWCGSTDELQADHIVRVSDEPALTFELSNLQTLCQSCHTDKEREYADKESVRVNWINPDYAYLSELIKEKESDEPAPFF